ncbi:tetratricopeptide repeat protein [Pedobacter sp. SD-b]|uniref:Tetratricopeptide repeat protein n=1 Tax=Pedobacter segetis TaxID=2793069 RepID=A0ABS1BM44_9SPHI|nr:tetratricopeptide repeat protein [Pedobacter segetis]MBK0383953.1 tetratricopeptide repeat protein [Pedobacter segetis]
MRKIIIVFTLFFTSSTLLFAQLPAYFDINSKYKGATELFEQGKFAAASSLFYEVGKDKTVQTPQSFNNTFTSNLKVNSEFYRAVCALELGNDDAEQLFKRFIKNHPESPKAKQAYFQVGKYYFNQGNYEEALNWFTKVSSIDLTGKDDTEYKFKTAYSFFETKDYASAKPLFGLIKDENSQYSEQATYYYAYIAYADKEYDIALKNFEKLKNSENYKESYPYYISAIYFLDKRYDDVIAYAVPIVENTKQLNETEMLRIIAASYFAKEDYNNALSYYERFMKRDNGKTQNNQDSYQIGYTYYKLKKYNEAIVQLGKLINDKSNYSQAGLYTLGDAYLTKQDKRSARNVLQVSSKLDFDREIKEDALFNFAKLSYELQFNSIALDAIQQYLKDYPRSKKLIEAKTLLAKSLASTKNYRDAIDVLEGIENKSADAKEAYQKVTYFRALEFYNERAFENAIGLFLRSKNYPVDKDILALSTFWCAEAMYEVRKYGESVDNFETFLGMPAAKNTDLYNYANYALGYAALEGESYPKAATYFAKFLNGNEKDPKTIKDATLRLADAYFGAKNYGSALAYYNKIISQGGTSEDYALFQRGIIQGLQNQPDAKIATLQSLLSKFPNSNYADDAGFEIPYTYFLIGQGDIAKTDLTTFVAKYPRSSYIPRALVTIGLVNYDQKNDQAALETFKRVVSEYKSTDEAQQALKLIQKIYVDMGNATDFINYANTTSIGNYTTSEQDNIMFQAANTQYLRGNWEGAIESVNAYFDKFPKAIQDKQAKFIRAESYKNLGKFAPAIIDYEYILNDWTSEYTEKALVSISKIYLNNKQYNEAIVHLKKLEIASEYKADYSFAINNLMICYAGIKVPDQTLLYADLVKNYEKSSEDDKLKAGLYSGKAYLMQGDTTKGKKELEQVAKATKSIVGAEALYNVAEIQYLQKEFKASQKTCFDLVNNMPNYDYWFAKTFILLADDYAAQKDKVQAIATLKSVIDNYEGNDEILPTAKDKLKKLDTK